MGERFEMNEDKRDAIMRVFLEQKCFPVLTRKGASSSGGSQDPNAGFDVAACPEHDHDRYRVWWTYWFKQIWRLRAWVFNRKDPAETLEEMLTDIINYALIAVSMMVQDELIDLDLDEVDRVIEAQKLMGKRDAHQGG